MNNLLKLKHRVEEWPAIEYSESMDLKHDTDHVDVHVAIYYQENAGLLFFIGLK